MSSLHPGFRFDLSNALGRIGELAEQGRNMRPTATDPLTDPNALMDAWLGGEIELHVKLGGRAGLAGPDKCEFCVRLQYRRASGEATPGDRRGGAVPCVSDFYVDPSRGREEWLGRPVLVAVVDLRQQHKHMHGSPACVAVGLERADLCPVCSPETGHLEPTGGFGGVPGLGVEHGTFLCDDEVDGVFLARRELPGRSAASADERPCQVVEGGSIVAGDVAQEQPPAHRDWCDFLNDYGEAVAFGFVLRPRGKEWLTVSVASAGLDLSLQSVGVNYRLSPLEPRAIERPTIHRQQTTRL